MSSRVDLPTQPSAGPKVSAGTEIGVSALAGALAAVPLASLAGWGLLPLVWWDISALVYSSWVWFSIWPRDAEETARLAVPADPTRAAADALLLCAAVASLVAVGVVLGRAAASHGPAQVLLAGLGVTSVVVSWGVVHTVYTLRYARLYYSGSDGGIGFNEDEPPTYTDFAYVAFTLGMTFQVSDTELQTTEIRRTALTHALLSFLFGTGILATTINLIASLNS